MKSLRFILLLLSLTSLISCGGALLPGSSDPYKKIEYMSTAMAQGRWIPAERYVREALAIFKERNDKQGIADAYIAYGQYYKYGGWCKFEKDFCPKGSISRPKSIEYFKKAAVIFKNLNSNFGEARAYFGLASAYGGGGQFAESCKTFDKALIAYKKGKGKEKPFPFNRNFNSFEEMVNAFKEKACSQA